MDSSNRPPALVFACLKRLCDVQTKYLLTEAPRDAPITPRVALGAAVWLAGWLTNLQADHILINLRKPGETGAGSGRLAGGGRRDRGKGECTAECLSKLSGMPLPCHALHSAAHPAPLSASSPCPLSLYTGYKIPRGGAFAYVSAANYFGEIVEWVGWALVVGSLPAAAFALFTFCNLAPRGWRHHQW